MSPAVRYTITLDQPVLTWQVALHLRQPITDIRAYLMTLLAYTPHGDLVRPTGKGWSWSEQIEADFCYLPLGTTGQLVPLPPSHHEAGVARIELVVRPFVGPPAPPVSTVSTLCFVDLDQLAAQTPRVVTSHTPEVIDV